MANTRISNLTASASNLASTDLAPVVQTAGVGPVKMTGLQLAGGLLGSTTFNGSTVTTSSPVLNLTQTWNDGAGGTVTFTGLKFNATDTASASGSLLLDIGTGGGSYSSKFKVDKSGNITPSGGVYFTNARINQGTNTGLYVVSGTGATQTFAVSPSDTVPSIKVQSTGAFYWATSSNLDLANNNQTTLTSPTTATLQLGAADTTGTTAPTPQFLRVQSWSSSTTNNQTGADFTIQGSRGTGTGAGGSIIFQVAPAGAVSNGVQNGYSTALTLASSGAATFGGSVTIGTGNISYLSINPTGYTNGIILSNTGSNMDIALVSGGSIHWSENATNAGSGTAANGVWLWRDAANTLALRNGTSAQTFRVYNTYTSSTNYETFKIDWITTANTCLIGTEKGSGGGNARTLALQTDGTTRLEITGAGGALFNYAYWHFRSTGSSSASASVISPSNGVMTLGNYNADNFDRLQFGGTSSSFPALKRVSANLQVIAADNSSSAGFIVGNQALATAATDGFLYIPTCAGTPTGTPTTQTGTAPLVVDSTNNKLYVYVGGAWTAMN